MARKQLLSAFQTKHSAHVTHVSNFGHLSLSKYHDSFHLFPIVSTTWLIFEPIAPKPNKPVLERPYNVKDLMRLDARKYLLT